jgi:hypothetical protein
LECGIAGWCRLARLLADDRDLQAFRGIVAGLPFRRLDSLGDVEHVSIDIGGLRFDHADDDAANDVLYLHVGEPQSGEGEETPEGHVVRYAPGAGRVVGLTLLGARHVLACDGWLAITVPMTVETTSEQLAPAFAAI